jgi:hypothetical protein
VHTGRAGNFKFAPGNEFKLTIALEWLCCYRASLETGWRDCNICGGVYCEVHVRCSSAIRMLGKTKCDDSEEEKKGENRKSENISELKKRKKMKTRKNRKFIKIHTAVLSVLCVMF